MGIKKFASCFNKSGGRGKASRLLPVVYYIIMYIVATTKGSPLACSDKGTRVCADETPTSSALPLCVLRVARR